MQNKTTVCNATKTAWAAHLQRYNSQWKRQIQGSIQKFNSHGQKAQQSLFYNIFKKNKHVLHEPRHAENHRKRDECWLTTTKFMVTLIQIFIYIAGKPQSRPGYKIFVTAYCFNWESEHDCTFFDKPLHIIWHFSEQTKICAYVIEKKKKQEPLRNLTNETVIYLKISTFLHFPLIETLNLMNSVRLFLL